MRKMNKDKKIQDLLKENRRLRLLADRDFLTGLFNRKRLEEDIQRYIKLNKRHGINFFLIMIDINNFKTINDTKGHIVGDKVLKEVSGILKNTIRTSDRVYRLGGDEFIIIFSHYKSTQEIIRRIQNALQKIHISISIGTCELKNQSCVKMLNKIDKKMYEKKREN